MTDKLFESFSALDDDLIERSFEKRSGRRHIFPLAALAACLAAAFLAAVPGMRTKDSAATEAEGNFFAMDEVREEDTNASAWTGGGDMGIQAVNGTAPESGAGMDAPGAVFPGASPDSIDGASGGIAVDNSAGNAPSGDASEAVTALPGADGCDIPEDNEILDAPADTGGPISPMSPPELTYNPARALPEDPAPTGPDCSSVSLTAEQLAQVWSTDCPVALLEQGEQDVWDHGANLSGEAVYNGGELEKLVLTFREEENPVTAYAEVTSSDSLSPGRAALSKETEPVLSSMGPLECLAYRCDGPEDTLFGAVFLIGQVRWEVRALASPGQEPDAQSIVTRFCMSYERNAMDGIFPDLNSLTEAPQ